LEGVTESDGSFFPVFAYLESGNPPDTGFLFDIQVEVEGFEQHKVMQV
jgi:hypothetical protein